MSKVGSSENPVEVGGDYRERVLTVEPHGIEQVSASERHGRPRALFTLWLSANMGLPVWLVGALAIVFGLGFADGVIAILVGNLIGCGLLALTASMGPEFGMPQLAFTRHSFGLRGAYVPALLNWVSASGWYAVNSIVGSLAIARLTTLPFWVSLLVLTVAQMMLGIYGYNLIHRIRGDQRRAAGDHLPGHVGHWPAAGALWPRINAAFRRSSRPVRAHDDSGGLLRL